MALFIRSAQFNGGNHLAVAFHLLFGHHPWDAVVRTPQRPRTGLFSQHPVEGHFRHAVQRCGFLHDLATRSAARWKGAQSPTQMEERFGRNAFTCHNGALTRRPETFKTACSRPGVAHRVDGTPMPEIVLNQTQIVAAIGQGISAPMSQHMRMHRKS